MPKQTGSDSGIGYGTMFYVVPLQQYSIDTKYKIKFHNFHLVGYTILPTCTRYWEPQWTTPKVHVMYFNTSLLLQAYNPTCSENQAGTIVHK